MYLRAKLMRMVVQPSVLCFGLVVLYMVSQDQKLGYFVPGIRIHSFQLTTRHEFAYI
jgi:hypothetical protein